MSEIAPLSWKEQRAVAAKEKAEQKAVTAAAKALAAAELEAKTGKQLFHAWGTIVFVYEKEVWHGVPYGPNSQGGSIVGARAEVITQGQASQRITATRLVAFGVFALAAPKKTGNQKVYLHVTAPTFEFLYEPIGGPTQTAMNAMNATAIAINKQARAAAQDAPAAVDSSSVADELTKWADLRDRGVISEEEFAAKKTALLS